MKMHTVRESQGKKATRNRTARMNRTKMLGCLLFIAVYMVTQSAVAINQYSNPLDVVTADPFIFWDASDNCYYLLGTGSSFWKSDDAVNWKKQGTLYAESNAGAWGSEITKGNDGKYYLFVSSVSTDSGDVGPDGIQPRRYISVYKSNAMATNSFVLHKKELAGIGPADPEDLIGPHVFKDNGNYYLYYTLDQTKCEDPTRGHNASIWVQQINSTFNGKIGTAQKLVWPSDANDSVWCEGVHVWENNSTYYLFYSTFSFTEENYRIRTVVSASPSGFSNYGKAAVPLLKKQQLTGGYLSGPGSSCIFETKDGNELFLGYHNHVSSVMGGGLRQLAIDRITFPGGVASVTPTRTKQLLPSGSSSYYPYWGTSHFQSWPLGGHWKNVFNQDDAKVEVNSSGWLEFTPQVPVELTAGGVTEVYNKNVYLCYTTLDFETNLNFIVKVDVDRDAVSTNTIYGGITVWQDPRENIQVRLLAPSKAVQVVITAGGVPTIYEYAPVALSTAYLRVRYNHITDKFRFDVGSDGTSWSALKYYSNPFQSNRDLKAGLVIGADGFYWNNKVRFDFFTMERW